VSDWEFVVMTSFKGMRVRVECPRGVVILATGECGARDTKTSHKIIKIPVGAWRAGVEVYHDHFIIRGSINSSF
jgi:hypothetical protein